MASASAAPDVSHIAALSTKATELLAKGHAARAAEKLEEAAAAAQAALPDAEHCLVLAALRAQQAGALLRTAHPQGGARAPNADALKERVFGTLLSAIMTALEARLAANTLMPGRCRPAELAWEAAHVRHSCVHSGLSDDPQEVDDIATRVAPYIGYETYMLARTHRAVGAGRVARAAAAAQRWRSDGAAPQAPAGVPACRAGAGCAAAQLLGRRPRLRVGAGA
jgi:hypothetical protein